LNKAIFEIFLVAVTNESVELNVAVNLTVFEPELEAAVTAALFSINLDIDLLYTIL